MMRVCTLQRWVIWMRLRIVPVQFHFALPNFITVPVYDRRQAMIQDSLTDNQPDSLIKTQFACYPCECCATPNKSHRGTAYRREPLWERIQEQLVILWCA